MSPRTRVIVVVALAAVAASGAAVGITLATRTAVSAPRSAPKPPPFVPDPLASAAVTHDVRAALHAWPAGTIRHLRALAGEHPRSGLVRLELGLALAFANRDAEAAQAWRQAALAQPDSPSAVHAEDLRHPGSPPGLPPFVPASSLPAGRVGGQLAIGARLLAAGRRLSAQSAFADAARRAPNDPEVRVANAVALFVKDNPGAAFSHLGPLVRRFPRAQTVRFHLGLLLIYAGELPLARHELALARKEGPRTRLGKQARTLLEAGRKQP